MPTVKFDIQEEVMRDALKIKEQLGLTWREIALQGLGMAVIPPPRIGRPPKPKIREKTDDHQKLEKQIITIFNKTFYNVAIWREFLPLIDLSDMGYKFYKYEDIEIKLPIISHTFHVYKNGQLNTQGIQGSATKIAHDEGKLVLTGEHDGWGALGIKGMLTTDGRNIMCASELWPEGVVKDIVKVRRQFKPKDPLMLIVSSGGYELLSQVMWEDPTHVRPPTTYKNFLIEQGIINKIFEVDELYTQRGTQNSAIIYTPSRENAWLVQGGKPFPRVWEAQDKEVMCTVREVVNIIVAKPSAITEITNISGSTPPENTSNIAMN